MGLDKIFENLKAMDSKSRETIVSAIQELVEVSTDKPGIGEKFQSRKFLLAIAGVVAGIIAGVFGIDHNTTFVIMGGVLIIGSMLIYTVTEGHIDAARAKTTIATINTLSGFLIGTIDYTTAMDNLKREESEEDDGEDGSNPE